MKATVAAAEQSPTAGAASKVKLTVFHQFNILSENEILVSASRGTCDAASIAENIMLLCLYLVMSS